MNTELRVGDAERDEVTSALHEHFAQGRLTHEELDERLTATLSARTVGDLREVTRDLPGPPPEQAPAVPWERGPRERGTAYWGRGPLEPVSRPWPRHGWGPPHARVPRHGWGRPGRRPFGPLLLVALIVAAFTGWWVIFPVLFCAWFAAAFTRFWRVQRQRLPTASRR